MNINWHESCGVYVVLYEQGVGKGDHDSTIPTSALVFPAHFNQKIPRMMDDTLLFAAQGAFSLCHLRQLTIIVYT